MNPTSISNLDFSQLSIGPIKTTAIGTKTIPLLFKGTQLELILPKMVIPFVPSDFKGNKKYQCCLQMGNSEACQQMQSKLRDLDEWLCDLASKQSIDFLGPSKKLYSREVVESKYKSIFKWAKDKHSGEINTKFPPTIRLSLPTIKGDSPVFMCDFYDPSAKEMDITSDNIVGMIPQSSLVTCVVKPVIWISGNGYGITLYPEQMKIYPPPAVSVKQKHTKLCVLVDDPTD